MTSNLSTNDKVSVRNGEYEATVLGISDDEESALLFAPVGTVGTPSGAVSEPIDDLEVMKNNHEYEM